MTADLRKSLQRLADDCDERARPPCEAFAMSLYWRAAQEARRYAADRYAGEDRLRIALSALEAQRTVAGWYDAPEAGFESLPPSAPATAPIERPDPSELLDAAQLAEIHGMTARGARKAIVNAFDRRQPGFYRMGRRWLAEPEAFARRRKSSA